MNESSQARWHRISLACALAGAALSLSCGGLLAWEQTQGKVPKLVDATELPRLREELRHTPKDDALKQRIRRIDLQQRQRTFGHLLVSHTAARALVFGGLIMFLAGAHLSRVFGPIVPLPRPHGRLAPDGEAKANRASSYAVAGACVVLAGAAWAAAQHPVRLPEPAPEAAAGAGAAGAGAGAAAAAFPTREEVKQNWPSFRGPDGSGVSKTAQIPLSWDAKSGANIRWKTPVPLPGMSSPIVWSNSVFLTGADEKENRVFRFDADTGAILWSAAVSVPGGAKPPPPKVGDDTGLAAPTAATDGRRVYALFPNGEVAAFDYAGKQVWARNIGPLENSYGYASSLALYQDRLCVQVDRGAAEDGESRMRALDTLSGKDRWQVKREVAGSWASPTIIEVDGQPQLLAAAAPLLIAYAPLDGSELWRAKCLESDVAPSPVCAGGMIVAVAPNTAILGVRTGGKGDVTATHVAWKAEDGVPDATSPVADEQHAYIVNSEGMLSCFDLKTGKIKWQHEIDDQFYASPVIAGPTMVLLGRKGVAYLVAPGEKFNQVGKGELGEGCGASPAPVGGRLYIRGQTNLFCIESTKK